MPKVVKKAESMKDLEALQPEGEIVRAGGVDIHVKPFTFGQLLRALKHLSNIGNDLITTEVNDIAIMSAFASHGDDVLGLLVLATGQDKEFFETLSSAEGIDVAVATWKVNKDFFDQQISPKLKNLQEVKGQSQDSPSDQTNPEEESN